MEKKQNEEFTLENSDLKVEVSSTSGMMKVAEYLILSYSLIKYN